MAPGMPLVVLDLSPSFCKSRATRGQAFRGSGVRAFRAGEVNGGPVFVDPERLNP